MRSGFKLLLNVAIFLVELQTGLRAYAPVEILEHVHVWFLADRTNGRAIATLLRLSSSSVCLSVCDVMYCG